MFADITGAIKASWVVEGAFEKVVALKNMAIENSVNDEVTQELS
jgi:hypothetical protein